jgi:hypothetical protein
MRTPQRIPIYLELLKNKKLIINEKEVDFSLIDFKLLSDAWEEYPDWRLTQLLVNTGIIPNTRGFWYYMEDHEFLMNLRFEIREVVLWGTNYTEAMIRLPETIWRPIKDLTTAHIEAILEGNWVRKESIYFEYFTNELNLRKNESTK